MWLRDGTLFPLRVHVKQCIVAKDAGRLSLRRRIRNGINVVFKFSAPLPIGPLPVLALSAPWPVDLFGSRLVHASRHSKSGRGPGTWAKGTHEATSATTFPGTLMVQPLAAT